MAETTQSYSGQVQSQPTTAQPRTDAIEPRRGLPLRDVVLYLVLIFGTILAVFPFIWMVSWSVMQHAEVVGGQTIPSSIQYENYAEAWERAEFSSLMWNSIRITGITIAGLLLLCVPAAYAFARMNFVGRDTLFAFMLATLMIPDVVTIIPNLLTVSWFNRFSIALFGEGGQWTNNWPSLTIPFMASAFTIFLLRQFFAQIPDDLWDAARIDGAGHIQFLIRVVLPLSRAPLMTIITLSFIGSWNALLWPLLVIQGDDWKPVALGLQTFVDQEAGSELNLQMAASVIMIIPILVLYFFTQRQFTKGVFAGSFKA